LAATTRNATSSTQRRSIRRLDCSPRQYGYSHGATIIAGAYAAIVAIVLVERGQVELVNHVNDEPTPVILRQLLGHARRHQELLIAIDRTEVERHDNDHDDVQVRTRAP
jgi:hypothetical protein